MPKSGRFKQCYRNAWETLPELRGWLESVPGEPTKAYCRICKKTLYAHRLSLLQHSCTVRHSKLAKNKFLEDKRQKSIAAGLSETITVVQLSAESPIFKDENSDPMTDEVLTNNSTQESLDADLSEAISSVVELPVGSTDESESITSDVLSNVVDIVLNGFDGPVIDEYATPELYINSLNQPLPNNCYNNNSCPQVTDIRSPISTHVLDTSRGTPVQNLEVSLYQLIQGRWTLINDCVTNPDGRCESFIARENMTAGRYKLHFDVHRYFELRKQDFFYPFIEIVFDIRSPAECYHVPLILSPFGYSTYKGS